MKQHIEELRTMDNLPWIIFLILVLWLPVLHATREDEGKQDDTEIGGYFVHAYQNELRAQTKSSRRNDVKNTMADMLFNLNGDIEIGNQYSEYQFNKDNQNYHYYDNYRFHSSLNQNYDDQSKRKSSKGHRAIRNVEDDTILNTTNKGMTAFKANIKRNRIPCRKTFSCQGKCNEFINKPYFTCQCDSDCELFKDCCADYRTYCNHSTSTIKLNQNLFCCVKMPTLSDKFWAISKCPKEWKSNNVSLKCESFPEQITGDNVRSHVPVIGENQTIFYNEYCAECNNARVLEYFDLNITSTIRLIPRRSSTVEEAVTFALKYGQNVKLSIAPRAKTQNVRYCLPNCGRGSRGDGGGDLRHVTTFSIAVDFRSKISSSQKILCPNFAIEEYRYDTLLKICRRAESVVNKKNIDKYRVIIWLQTQSPYAQIREKAFTSSLEISFHIKSSNVSQVEIEKVPPDKFAVSFDLELSNEQILTLAKKANL